jgi:hypothetical protein
MKKNHSEQDQPENDKFNPYRSDRRDRTAGSKKAKRIE